MTGAAAVPERIRELRLLASGVCVLELGAGTGPATEQLLSAGAAVTAVEPGRSLADRLTRRCPDARVVVARAEDFDMGERQYDLAVAATSVHWLDLGCVLPKLRRALVAGGHFAVWRNAFGDPTRRSPFRERVDEIVARRDGEVDRGVPGELDTQAWVDRLASSGEFSAVHVDHFRWSIDLTAERIHDLFSTFSEWTADKVDATAAAVRQLGGVVTEHYVTPLIVLRSQDERGGPG